MEAIKTWWSDASARDQLAVLALGICVIVYGLFNYVLFPVVEMKDAQVNRVVAQEAAYERVKNLAAKLKSQTTSEDVSAVTASIEKTVEGSFNQHGLRVSGFDASGRSGIRVRFDTVDYEKLLGWFYDMEITQGLRMKDVSIAGSSAPGQVSASVLIQKNQ